MTRDELGDQWARAGAAEWQLAQTRAAVEALAERWESAFDALAPQALAWPAIAKGGLAILRSAADEVRAVLADMAPPERPPGTGVGDRSDIDAGRCCPHCRGMLTEHNVSVWNAGYAVGQRHAQES